jgi:hypothetical protein
MPASQEFSRKCFLPEGECLPYGVYGEFVHTVCLFVLCVSDFNLFAIEPP